MRVRVIPERMAGRAPQPQHLGRLRRALEPLRVDEAVGRRRFLGRERRRGCCARRRRASFRAAARRARAGRRRSGRRAPGPRPPAPGCSARPRPGTSASSGRPCGRRGAGGTRCRRRRAPSRSAGTRWCRGPSCRAAGTPGPRPPRRGTCPSRPPSRPRPRTSRALMNTGRGAQRAISSCASTGRSFGGQRAGVLEEVAGHPVVLAGAGERSRPARRSCGGWSLAPPSPDEPMKRDGEARRRRPSSTSAALP